MNLRTISCAFLLISLKWMAYGQFYGCATDADCHAFGNPACNTFFGYCESPFFNADCNYIGGAGTGYMVTISSVPLCTRTCTAHTDCASLPTAKICRSASPQYCVECLNTADCTAMGFKNHDCNSGFCANPNPSGTDCDAASGGSLYCAASVNCYSDTIRCWYPCTFNEDCTDSTCVIGVTPLGGGVCSSRTNLPPSISSSGCSTQNDCTTAAAAQCSGGNCVACSSNGHCTHLSSTPYCGGGTCRVCRTTDHLGCNSESSPRCDPGIYTCVGCIADEHCARFSLTPLCVSGTCRACRPADHDGCTSVSLARCDSGSFTCVACNGNIQCERFSLTPICVSGTCRACRPADHAGCNSESLAKCDSGTYACTACDANSQCTRFTSAPYCEGGECRPCKTSDNIGCTSVTASKCTSNPSYSCIACSTDLDCVHLSSTPYCEGGTCVYCLTSNNAGCGGGTPFCNGGTTCQACRTSDHAGCTTILAPKCISPSYTCTTCTIHADCTRFTSTPYCGGAGQCVICSTSDNSGCTDIAASKCSFDTNYQCIACSNDDDCAHLTSTPYCEGNICRPCKTSDNSGCPTTALAKCTDNPSYQCTTCSADEDCARFTSTPYCEGGECRPCKPSDNTGCTDITTAQCASTPSYQCIACSSDTHCTRFTSTPYCEGGTCVFCKVSDNTGCAGGGAPYCSGGITCQICRTSDNAGCTPAAPTCISPSYSCTTCTIDAQCTRFTSTPYCGEGGGSCVLCRTSDNSGCTSITASKCVSFPTYECIACSVDNDCSHLSTTPFCEGGSCRPCKTADHTGCTALTASKCTSSPTYSCTTCSADEDCARFTSTPYCEGGECRPCKTTDNSGCTTVAAAKCASTPSYQCTACVLDADCTHLSSTPYCEGGTCVFCKTSDNSGCTVITASKCIGAPPNTCTVCSIDADCTHLSSTPFCEGSTCRPCKTTDNSGCTSTAAPKCTFLPSYSCTTCSGDVDCTHLSLTPYCDGSTCQICKTTDNTGCDSSFSRPKCITSTNGDNLCGQCATDLDCANSPVGKTCNSNYTCISTALSNANMTLASGSKRDLTVTFSEDLSVLPPDCQFFFLEIENLTWPTDFSYTWELKDDHTISVTLEYYGQIEIKKNKLQLLFNSSAIPVSSNFTIPKNLSLTLPNSIPLSAPALSVVKGINTASQVIAGAAVAATAPAIFSSGVFSSLWNFISICQIVNYLLYLLVNWPENALMVFDIFSAASLKFFPNPFQGIIDDIEQLGSMIKLPAVFADNGAQGLFISDSGSTVGVWGLVLIFYLLTKASRFMMKNSVGKLSRVIQYFCGNLEWRAVIRSVSSSFLSLALGASLQLYSVSFDNWAVGLSSVLAVLFGYFLLFYIAICCYLLYNRPEPTKDNNEVFEKKFGPLVEDFKDETKFQRCFIIFVLVRQATFVGFLVGFSDNIAMAQVPMVAINCFLIFLFIFLLKPYKERKEMLSNTLNEGIICCLMICALVLLNDQERSHWMSYSDKINLGWVVVAICSLLILINAIFIIYETYQTYRQWFFYAKAWCLKRRNLKGMDSTHRNLSRNRRVNKFQKSTDPSFKNTIKLSGRRSKRHLATQKPYANETTTVIDLNDMQTKAGDSKDHILDDSKLFPTHSNPRKRSLLEHLDQNKGIISDLQHKRFQNLKLSPFEQQIIGNKTSRTPEPDSQQEVPLKIVRKARGPKISFTHRNLNNDNI